MSRHFILTQPAKGNYSNTENRRHMLFACGIWQNGWTTNLRMNKLILPVSSRVLCCRWPEELALTTAPGHQQTHYASHYNHCEQQPQLVSSVHRFKVFIYLIKVSVRWVIKSLKFASMCFSKVLTFLSTFFFLLVLHVLN